MVRSPGRRSAGCGTAGVGASVSGPVRPPKMSLFGVLRRCAGSTRSRQIADICRFFSRCYRRREARSALRSEGKVGSFGSGPLETLNGPVNLVGSMTWIVRKAEFADNGWNGLKASWAVRAKTAVASEPAIDHVGVGNKKTAWDVVPNLPAPPLRRP